MKLLFSLLMIALLVTACNNDPAKNPVMGEDYPHAGQPEEQPAAKKKAAQSTKKDKPAAEDDEASHEAKPNPTAEEKVVDLVLDLPEIQKMDESIRKKSDGKRGLKAFVSNRPSDDEEYYTVSVAEDNGQSLATYYTFHVYPDYSIQYYDVVSDSEKTLKEWRRELR